MSLISLLIKNYFINIKSKLCMVTINDIIVLKTERKIKLVVELCYLNCPVFNDW